uniref:Aldehyde dehydrogenase domain-containing protein n=1 Tax=Ditylenchus dipsaci TaxID=166011 RepID=A0A915DU86_9BILA
MEECAKDIKKVSLELGGNAPFIVFDDADLDKASRARSSPNGVYDAFAEKLGGCVAKLKIGNGLEDGTTTGPLIDGKAVAKVQEHIEDAVSKGAKVLSGGKLIEGNFFRADHPG